MFSDHNNHLVTASMYICMSKAIKWVIVIVKYVSPASGMPGDLIIGWRGGDFLAYILMLLRLVLHGTL